MTKQNVFVAKNDDGWYTKSEGASRAAGQFKTQTEAIARGKEIASKRGSELTIFGADGKIRDKRSYGNDPYPPRG